MNRNVPLVFVLVFLTASCTVAVLPAKASEDTWSTMAPMPTARSDLGVGVVNGKIYAIGGGSQLSWSYVSTNEEYNPITNSWTTKKPMPTATQSFGVAVYQNKIYVIGGTVQGSPGNEYFNTWSNFVYDPATDSWETKAPMPTSRSQIKANTVDGKIYVTGGRASGALNKTEVYDPVSDSWTTKAPMLYPVASSASAVVGNKIYVFGGQDEFDPRMNLDITQIYDTATDNWTLGKSAPSIIFQAAAGVTSGEVAPRRIYVAGGYPSGSGRPQTDRAFVYDPQADVWANAAAMPTARYCPALGVVNDVLYVIGGGQDWTYSLSTNERYIPVGYFGPDISIPPSQSPSPSPTPSISPAPTYDFPPITPTPTPTPAPTANPTSTPTPSISPAPTYDFPPITPTPTPTPAPTANPTSTPTPTPTVSPTPSPSPFPTPTTQQSIEPTQSAQPTTPPKGANPSYLILGIVVAAIVAVTVVGLAGYYKKYRKTAY